MLAAASIVAFGSSADYIYAVQRSTEISKRAILRARTGQDAVRIHNATACSHCTGDAVIVEPRRLLRMPLVLHNVRTHLPSDWRVRHMHRPGAIAAEIARADLLPYPLLSHAIRTGALMLEPLPFDPPGRNRVWYNAYLLSPGFWLHFSSPWLLLFEADAVLCPQPTWALSTFLHRRFMYIGAPWRGPKTPPAYLRHHIVCCNSGLSLWRRDKVVSSNMSREMHEGGARRCGGRRHGCEAALIDNEAALWLAAAGNAGRLKGPAMPTGPEAMRFSAESWYDGGFTPFGAHDALNCVLVSGRRCFDELLRRCPPVAIMFANSSALPGKGERQLLAVAGAQRFFDA